MMQQPNRRPQPQNPALQGLQAAAPRSGGWGAPQYPGFEPGSPAPTGRGPGGWAMPGEGGVGPSGSGTGYGGGAGPITGWNVGPGAGNISPVRGNPNPYPNINPGMIGLMGPPAPSGPPPSNGPGGPEMGGLISPLPDISYIPELQPVDDSQAAREAYARAKDTAGQQGRAAMDALMDVQGARGIVGSGIGLNEAGGVIGEASRQLGDFNREQMIQRVENERRRREMAYQGLINQRGQNINMRGQELDRRRYNAGNSPRGTYVY